MSKISFNEEDQKRYVKNGLDKIIPMSVALRVKELVDCGELTEEYMDRVANNPQYFSKRKSWNTVGNRYGGGYRFLDKNRKAFNGLTLVKSCSRTNGLYFWSKKTGHIWLSLFESYLFVSEWRNAYINSLHLVCDGTSNPEPFNKPIGHYNFY